MSKLHNEIVEFFRRQNFVIVSTLDRQGSIHNSCKGIVEVNKDGQLYLLDLYYGETFKNLKNNPHISVTAVDEHGFSGYCIKGKVKLIKAQELDPLVSKTWEEKLAARISQRIVRNVRGEKGHPHHPEAVMPKPQYMILMEVDSVIDLIPGHIKAAGKK